MVASSAVIASNWISFLALETAFICLIVQALRYKGPSGQEKYYNGYREQNMLGVFINLWCAVSYFAKIIQSQSNNDGFVIFTTLRYVDYCMTCPILTLDLMWNLDAPYKITSALLVLTCLVHAVASFLAPPPASYAWFAMGLSLFIFTYTFILSIVRERLDFYTFCARDNNAKRSIRYLKTACFCYFGIWVFFPVLWILSERAANLIGSDLNHVFHCILDVIAKSCYGFALLYFKMYFDKKLIESGVDEEEFAKFSKEVVTHKNKDEQGLERTSSLGEMDGHKLRASRMAGDYEEETEGSEVEMKSSLKDRIRKSVSRQDAKLQPRPQSPRRLPAKQFSVRSSGSGSKAAPPSSFSPSDAVMYEPRASMEEAVLHFNRSPGDEQSMYQANRIPSMHEEAQFSDEEDDAAYLRRAKQAYMEAKSGHERRGSRGPRSAGRDRRKSGPRGEAGDDGQDLW
uniref:Uncharacterized protein n=1 Tax=Hanusia phi TaxID=3032 RepID=A0A7S0EDV8_9CRYP|mmetsp:Transcript_22520/g.50723  ORF Transcript_22520/g.50723 Transcript_22520/m.50723 type:complete len:457 (+) Transcript_22520:70-1440(+)